MLKIHLNLRLILLIYYWKIIVITFVKGMQIVPDLEVTNQYPLSLSKVASLQSIKRIFIRVENFEAFEKLNELHDNL